MITLNSSSVSVYIAFLIQSILWKGYWCISICHGPWSAFGILDIHHQVCFVVLANSKHMVATSRYNETTKRGNGMARNKKVQVPVQRSNYGSLYLFAAELIWHVDFVRLHVYRVKMLAKLMTCPCIS
jgi:putative intracellular protease/amidase